MTELGDCLAASPSLVLIFHNHKSRVYLPSTEESSAESAAEVEGVSCKGTCAGTGRAGTGKDDDLLP